MEKNETWLAGILCSSLTALLLAATLEVALPNLQVEVPGAEGESLPGEAIASPRPMRHETAGGSIHQRR